MKLYKEMGILLLGIDSLRLQIIVEDRVLENRSIYTWLEYLHLVGSTGRSKVWV